MKDIKVKLISRKISLLLTLGVTLNLFVSAQDSMINFIDAKEFILIGREYSQNEDYHRVDTSIYKNLPQNTKRLLTNSSGLAIIFKTNSKKIEAAWTLSSYKVGSNMTAIAHSGLDLYRKENNKWIFAGVGRPSDITSSYTLVENMEGQYSEYLLYLPLYNTVEKLEIGVDKDARIISISNPFDKKIAIYGSSITQGASASRPGMSYPSRIGRELGGRDYKFRSER